MLRLRLLVLLAVLLGTTALAVPALRTATAAFRARQLEAICPDLPADLARHVASDGDREWFAYCTTIGTRGVFDAFTSVFTALHTDDFARFRRIRRPLEQVCLRLARALSEVYGMHSTLEEYRFLSSFDNQQDFEFRRMATRMTALTENTGIRAEVRLAGVRESERTAIETGNVWYALRMSLVAAHLELERGHPERHRELLERGLATAIALHEEYLACQVLGELAWVHRDAGEADSMNLRFAEGLQRARQHAFLDQAARILRFQSAYFADHRRLALAADRLAEAQRLCDTPSAGSARLRMAVERATWFARFDCWDLVERELHRLPPLLREFPRSGRLAEVRKFALDVNRLQARLEFVRGDFESGDRRMRMLADSLALGERRIGYAVLFDEWSDGLQRSDRFADAVAACDRGLAHCDSAHVPDIAIRMLERRAECLQRLGRWGEARLASQELAARLAKDAVEDGGLLDAVQVLECRNDYQAHRVAAARAGLQRCLDGFRRRLADRENGPQSYLELSEVLTLRDAIHEMAGFGPAAGYTFEREWRSMSEALGGTRGAGRLHRLRLGEIAAARVHRPGPGAHLVYAFVNRRLLRWTATRTGVTLDTLAMNERQCLARVRECLALLQDEPAPRGGFLGPKALAETRALAAILLPPDVAAMVARGEPIEISADGPLTALPFEALPIACADGERPLALCADVSYVHGRHRAIARTPRAAVILSNPYLTPEIKRRYAPLASLRGSGEEIGAARARWPDAVVLSGAAATKDAVLGSFQDASAIYLAAHHVRDPDSPFLGFVPLAAPKGSTPDAAVFEIADVQALDLSACELVVLASCASGAPYRLAVRPGPSLGDAFLDSGAHAVVQSQWDVGDDETRTFMMRFLADSTAPHSPVAALNRARRDRMSSPSGLPPRVWAAWSVHVPWPEPRGQARRRSPAARARF